MEAATLLEITPETLRQRAQASRERADRLREEVRRLSVEAIRLEREADALEEAQRLRSMQAPAPSARAALAGEIAAYLARCRTPNTSTEIGEHFGVSSGRARVSLELLTEIGMVYRSGLKRGTRYRILRDGEEPPDEARPFGERWHEHVRDVAIRLQTFTQAEIVAEIPEVADVTVYRWLRKLVDDGILTVERVGKAHVYAYENGKVPAPQPIRPRNGDGRDETARRGGAQAIAGTGKRKYSRSEVAEVVRIAKAAGAEIRPQKHGYAVVVDGATVTSVPRTPSDHRSLKNARKAMDRGGIRA
jgi:DNA-binding transcriptional ArsR family regulator